MTENNVKIRFKYDMNEMMEIKEYDEWCLRKVKVIIDTKKIKRKEQKRKDWINSLEQELTSEIEIVKVEEKKDKTIVSIKKQFINMDYETSKESCYKLVMRALPFLEKVLQKFRINNYEIIYEFQPDRWFIEENKRLIEMNKNDSNNKECIIDTLSCNN